MEVYYVNNTGICVTGWQNIGVKKYWFSSAGVMATGTKTIGVKQYTFGTNGALKSSPGNGINVTASYIGNKHTKKFHKAGCSSVSSMNASNKVGFKNRADAISVGYEP